MSEHNNLQQQMSAILARAAKDKAFCRRLLSNPKAIMEQEGITLPPDMNIQVYEDPPTTLNLVLQSNAQAGDLVELSDAELEAATGGIQPSGPPPDSPGTVNIYLSTSYNN